MLEVAKMMDQSKGSRDLFVLTARPQAAAPAIKAFLDQNGLNIPIENQTPKDINLKEPNQEIQDTQETKIPLKARWKLPERPKKRPNNPI